MNELKDRGADFQPPAIARASAIAHARQESVVASQVKANADAEALEYAAYDKATAAVVPASAGALGRGSVSVEEGAARAKRSMEEGQIRRNRGYADDGIPKPPLDGSHRAVPMVAVPATPVPAAATDAALIERERVAKVERERLAAEARARGEVV